MITDAVIYCAYLGADMGELDTPEDRRWAVANAVLRLACGYGIGKTMSHILHEIGITKKLHGKPRKSARKWAYGVILNESASNTEQAMYYRRIGGES